MICALAPRFKELSVVLASQSPRRREILEKLGLPFLVYASQFAEDLDKSKYLGVPNLYVIDNARYKAETVLKTLETDKQTPDLIIGADTVVTFDGDIYEKPQSREHAVQILSKLNGKFHEVHSGVALLYRFNKSEQHKVVTFSEKTLVKFGDLSEDLIEAYVATGESMDKAGAYGIQGFGAALIERIDGDFYNVMGFPLHRFTTELLKIYSC